MYALITGASSGIGKEMAIQLAEKDVNLILVARRHERLLDLQKTIQKTHPVNVIVYPIDLTNEPSLYALHKSCQNYDVRIVVNCAGFGKMGLFLDTPLEEELDMIKTNVTAVHILTKLFADSMQRGVILNVASIAAFAPVPLLSAYGATKAYVQSLSRAVNYELKKSGKNVRVTTLCPGPVDTEFNAVAHGGFKIPGMPPKKCAKYAVDGIFHKKELILPGFVPKAMHILSRITPTALQLPIEYFIESCKK